VLVGMGGAEEVTENLAMAKMQIPQAFWEALRESGLTI
jgi:hypothetical protein